ncbi:MAG TPA: hypothetical protein VMT09_06500 [Steroidobacteraceae bacterium]|nr:hypothetical protein [Steroidobacteraceae bacterium]
MRPAALRALFTAVAMGITAAPGSPTSASAAVDPYQPLAFLIGHCWRGTFADGAQTDEHCFSWIYGGKFVRDEHVVRRQGRPDGFGESIYLWDSAAARLEYLYIESAGGFSRGAVTAEDGALVFPAASYVEKGETRTYRSRWQRVGDDAYDVVTEFQAKDGWVPGLSLRMQRVRNAPT